jgi:hypothetical protein
MAKFKGWVNYKMTIKVFQRGIEIGTMTSFTITGEEIHCSNIHLVLNEGTFFYGNEEVQIKYTAIGQIEEKIYNFKIDLTGSVTCFHKDTRIQYIKGTILKTKVEEDHTGQIYNPYTDSWSWF